MLRESSTEVPYRPPVVAERQIEKAKACTMPEDVLALAKEEGYGFSDKGIAQISGGSWGQDGDNYPPDPTCHSTRVMRERLSGYESPRVYICLGYGHVW